LRQDTTDNRDGMDVALCLIDKNNMVLDFAGAKNPLVYIRNGELFEIKGDKNPVGGLQREEERKFVSHKLALDTPTVFYIFSDGYLDQFGGEKGRKFMKKNFYSLLLEIHQKPMDEQKEILFKTFKDWKGEQAQIDDVLVIGFKI
jgi:serine phosphatase RsbU (regulator of sigma subunit)